MSSDLMMAKKSSLTNLPSLSRVRLMAKASVFSRMVKLAVERLIQCKGGTQNKQKESYQGA